MIDFLKQMAGSSAERVVSARAREPEHELRRRCAGLPVPPALVLSPAGFDLIAEIKLRSPAAGVLGRPRTGLAEVVVQAAAYAAGGAAAISVLTEPSRFAGDLEHLAAVARTLPVPVLRKDFLVDPYQVLEARAAGAGGVLLIVRMLPDVLLREMLDVALANHLFVLLESFDAEDIERAAAEAHRVGAAPERVLLGLNVRDLMAFDVDLARLNRFAPCFPPGVVRVAESGLTETRGRRARGGARVPDGTGRRHLHAITRSRAGRRRDDRSWTCRKRVPRIPRPAHGTRQQETRMSIRVKICGLTTPEGVAAAVHSGADAVGFVFADSPRRVSARVAAELVSRLPSRVARVAVFRHPQPALVDEVMEIFAPDWIQSEAEDEPFYAARPGLRFLPVFHDGPDLVARLACWLEARREQTAASRPETILVEGESSGRGVCADWERVAAVTPGVRLVLSGGLDASNVGEAIRSVRPWAVDVSSGVESSRGVKDSGRIAAFVAAARVAGMRTGEGYAPRASLAALLRGEYPDARGRFGPFGGRFVPETLVTSLERLTAGARDALADPVFRTSLAAELRDWVGRPTPLTPARALGARWGAQVWLKREDLAHTGAHKINNAIGQALLAQRLGASRVVAETGAGQHGVAAAAACARLGIPCTVYMGAVDASRQAPNVDRMRRLGAEVRLVETGDRTLRAAIDAAMRDWVAHPRDTYYLLGSAVGPHPYPWLVRELQAVIGREAREQMLAQSGSLPGAAVACVGGGSNAIGLFHPFLADSAVALLGVEAGGRGAGASQHAATLAHGRPGVLHGSYSMLLQDDDGQVVETHSVSAGLDYPGVGPEHALLRALGRVGYVTATDDEALHALDECCALEGILPALESAHALAGARRHAAEHPGTTILDRSLRARRQGSARACLTWAGPEGRMNDWTSLDHPAAATPAASLEAALRAPSQAGRPAIVSFLTAGYPSFAAFAALLPKVAAASDAVEIGVPFSDPIADGVTIQRTSHAALAAGTSLRRILQHLATVAPRVAAPVLLMSYLNPLLAHGLREVAAAAGRAGVAGFIVPDLPLEESDPLRTALERHGLALVQLVTPVTPPGRLADLCRASRGFVYAVTVTGTTGGEVATEDVLAAYLDRVRAAATVPVLAGFGIRRPQQVRAIARHADGVVVGSALLELIERGEDPSAFLLSLRSS